MEWLGILAAILPHGRVAHMPHANIPAQPLHVLLCKDLGHHAVGLAKVKAIGVGDHPRGVLATVLDSQKALVDLRRNINAVGAKNSNEAAHSW